MNVLGSLLTNGSDVGHIKKAESVNVSAHVGLSLLEPEERSLSKGPRPVMPMCPQKGLIITLLVLPYLFRLSQRQMDMATTLYKI